MWDTFWGLASGHALGRQRWCTAHCAGPRARGHLCTAQGLEHADIMLLKPRRRASGDAQPAAGPPGAASAAAAAQSFLGRSSGGFCLAFPEGKNGREYLVGEDFLFSVTLLASASLACAVSGSGHVCCAKAWRVLASRGCTQRTSPQWSGVRHSGTSSDVVHVPTQAPTTATSTSAPSAARTATWRPTGATWRRCTRYASTPSSAPSSSRPRPTAPPACGPPAR